MSKSGYCEICKKDFKNHPRCSRCDILVGENHVYEGIRDSELLCEDCYRRKHNIVPPWLEDDSENVDDALSSSLSGLSDVVGTEVRFPLTPDSCVSRDY